MLDENPGWPSMGFNLHPEGIQDGHPTTKAILILTIDGREDGRRSNRDGAKMEQLMDHLDVMSDV